jgi:hypothetical protein
MSRLPLWLIVPGILVVGTPIVAMLLDIAMGPWSASAIEHDGTVTQMVFDRNLRRPEWVAIPSGASIVQASRVVNAPQHRDVQSLSLSTREHMAGIRAFYRDRLGHAGFVVTDLGTGPMNARTAAFIGVTDILSATRATTGDSLSITIHTPEGLFATTLIELRWAKVAVGKRSP